MNAGGTIYVQERPDGKFIADVAELPGCVAVAPTRDEAVASVRTAFADYLALMEARGVSTEHWRGLDPAAFRVQDPPAASTFPEDFRPLDEHDLRDFLHQLEASRAELLALVRELDAETMERRPDPATWSVREALEHIATTEVTYLSRLEKWPDRDFATLQAVHRMVVQRFAVMDAGETGIDHAIQGRRWSVRKVMRRLLAHEYEHLNHIKEILAKLR